MKHHQPPNSAARRHSGRFRRAGIGAAVFAAAMLALPAPFLAPPAAARDTDIWKPAAKNSAYFMVDRSGSMHYWVYDHSIDWAALYDNFMTRNDLSIAEVRAKFPDKKKNLQGGNGTSSQWVGQYIFDSYSQADGGGFRGYDIIANGPDDEHGLHYEKDRIYLVNWNIEVKVVNGVAITGDMPKSATGHRTKHWDKRVAQRTGKWEDALIAIDTKARLDENGNIVLEPGSMLSFAPDDPEHSHVLLNGKPLPLGQDLPEHKYIPLKNGTKLDNGFVGYLQSPGFVNSGYKSVPDGVEPYLGEASDKSLAATDKAREMLLAERAKMKTWNLQQWRDWADARFTADNSPDGKSTWRDWTGARTKWATTENGHTAHNVRWNYGTQESNADYKKLGSAATEWTAAAWYKFISDIDNYWATSSPNRSYFCVLLPEDKGGQQRGEFLLGRWAQAMYEKNLPEKQKWQQLAGAWEEETDGHNWLYAFVTGNYLNYVQSITLRYIDSPDLKGKTLQYPYPEAHNEANRDKNGGTVYQFGVSEITDNDSSYIPREQPQFDRYYVQDGKLKIRDNARYASMNPLFYEGWPDRQGKRVQNRFEALRSALVHTLDNYGDKMNWGFAAYPRKKAPNDRGYIHGATDKSFAGVWEDEQGNPRSTLLDLTRDPAALLKDVREKASTTGAGGGTPMTGSLQHVWYNGFHKPYTEGKLGREEDCGKYYVITLADGMASVDFNHSADDSCYGEYFGHAGDCRRKEPIVPLNAPIHPNYNGRKPPSYAKPFAQCDTGALGSAKNKGSWDALPGFQNWDCDYWRNDASQGIGHVGTLYDDVAAYMYTHSFKTGEEICNPFDTDSGKAAQCRQKLKDSQDNVKSHHISLGLVVPAMRDAAESTGGRYFVASNKDQLVAVFEDLAESMSEAASFTAPSVPADAQNSLESGEDVYMGLFMPLAEGPWAGNVKWFKRGKTEDNRNPYGFYGKDYQTATNDDGEFLEDATDWWGDAAFNSKATDTNITDDGAGEVLLKAVQAHFASGNYYQRKIYTCELDDDDDDDDECELVELYKAFSDDDDDDELDEDLYKKHLKVDSEAEARQVINFTYGFETNAKGEPTAARAWPLGAIIHSQPIAIDYYANAEVDEPYHRLIAAGANDGMLHVFDADSGEEVFAFIPRDILPKLKDMRSGFTDGVDGELTLYRAGDPPRQPKYLIFGERRGGGTYWCLDIEMEKGTLWKDNPWQPVKDGEARWKVQWVFGHPEIAQSWSKPQTARIPVKLEKSGDGDKRTYQDVVIFTAGYDEAEDNFPEPFNDQAGPEAEQNTGTPFALATASGGVNAGEIISAKWSPGAAQTDGTCEKTKFDPNGNCKYDIQNPDANEKGRALFVVAIDDPKKEIKARYYKFDMTSGRYSESETEEVVLPFTLTYGENDDAGNGRTRSDMIYSFPATPATVAYTDAFMDQAKGEVDTRTNVLDTVYAPDIYGNLFKARYNIAFENFGTIDEPDWRLRGEGWEVAKVFTANPGSATEPAGVEGAQVAADVGRKVFYPPTVSWGGTESFFEAANFAFYDDEAHTAEDFRNRNGIASVFFGTGDREHPTYTMVSNRIYGVYDDSSMYVRKANGTKQEISSVSFAPYDERDLLNLTCDELGSEFDNPSYLWSDNNADAMTDFNSWLQATFKRDWNGDGEVNESDAASLEAVVTELTEGGYKNDFCEWVEERQPWKYKGEEGASQLTTDCASGSLAREYLAKQYLGETLTDDARDRYEEKLAELERGGARNSSGKRQGTENDRKGWFIKLDEQGYGGACGHMTTPSTGYDPERDNHRGEQVLAPLTLYYGTLYLTSYQSDLSDPCKTGSNAFTYAIDYKTGKAPYNYHIGDSGLNMIDRYYKYEGILGLPSGVTFIFDGDTVVPVAQLGGNKLAGFSEVCPPGEENCEDKAPGLGGVSTPSPGLELYYWRDSNSQSPDDLNGIEGGGNNGGNP